MTRVCGVQERSTRSNGRRSTTRLETTATTVSIHVLASSCSFLQGYEGGSFFSFLRLPTFVLKWMEPFNPTFPFNVYRDPLSILSRGVCKISLLIRDLLRMQDKMVLFCCARRRSQVFSSRGNGQESIPFVSVVQIGWK